MPTGALRIKIMPDLFSQIIGQDRAKKTLAAMLSDLVQAYLFVGPQGVGKMPAATSFAAGILCEKGGCGDCEICVRVLNRQHPDVTYVRRVGASISVDQAREIVRIANRSPIEGKRQVIIIDELHLVDEAAPALLKTIEEPPSTTFFIICTEQINAQLVTIASRCVRIDFPPLPTEVIKSHLISKGIDSQLAEKISYLSYGNMTRAEMLALDNSFLERANLWLSIPDSNLTSGSQVVKKVESIMAAIDKLIEPIEERQQKEVVEFQKFAKELGEKATAKKEMEDRHKRERRRIRTDEIRFGLLGLANEYKSRAVTAENAAGRDGCFRAIELINMANESLIRNPNETLLLEALLLELSKAPVSSKL